MYYIYVLLGLKDKSIYLGFTQNLRRRIDLHKRGFMMQNKRPGPFKLIYLEACLNKEDATRRMKYLNSHFGKRYLKNRLKEYFSSS